jgi:hypothetical protein
MWYRASWDPKWLVKKFDWFWLVGHNDWAMGWHLAHPHSPLYMVSHFGWHWRNHLHIILDVVGTIGSQHNGCEWICFKHPYLSSPSCCSLKKGGLSVSLLIFLSQLVSLSFGIGNLLLFYLFIMMHLGKIKFVV